MRIPALSFENVIAALVYALLAFLLVLAIAGVWVSVAEGKTHGRAHRDMYILSGKEKH